jgi:hypothetical protein
MVVAANTAKVTEAPAGELAKGGSVCVVPTAVTRTNCPRFVAVSPVFVETAVIPV